MTDWSREQSQVQHYFNSHPHEEDDPLIFVSNHHTHYFNSHPHEEDDAVPRMHSLVLLFQLTSSRRGWRFSSVCKNEFCNFNSHPHEEDDHAVLLKRIPNQISTHILTKRMTNVIHIYVMHFYFNSHPHEEDDRLCGYCIPGKGYFNSHPHEEDDTRKTGRKISEAYFNSHPHEEDDRLQDYLCF